MDTKWKVSGDEGLQNGEPKMTREHFDQQLDEWSPCTLDQIGQIFSGFDGMWWVAGGWAIDLFVGQQTRDHGDIDVGILRKDQVLVHSLLNGWDIYVADPPGHLRPWRRTEWVQEGIHDVWCRPSPTEPWALQLILNDADESDWIFRRNPSIRFSLSALCRNAVNGLPYLTPEVQLLFKTKRTRPKDEDDFRVAEPLLSKVQKNWLLRAIQEVHPAHPWLMILDPTAEMKW